MRHRLLSRPTRGNCRASHIPKTPHALLNLERRLASPRPPGSRRAKLLQLKVHRSLGANWALKSGMLIQWPTAVRAIACGGDRASIRERRPRFSLLGTTRSVHNHRMPDSPWTDKADALIRVTHPDFAAQKLHLPLESILARRKELELPPVDEQFPKWGLGRRQQKGA